VAGSWAAVLAGGVEWRIPGRVARGGLRLGESAGISL
jgi:hypothetical protein